jgi:hypothetical protein
MVMDRAMIAATEPRAGRPPTIHRFDRFDCAAYPVLTETFLRHLFCGENVHLG